MEEAEVKEKKTNKAIYIYIILVVVLVIIIILMGLYIAYDKGVIFSSEKEIKESNKSKKKTVVPEKEELYDFEDEIKDLDLSKCLNSNDGQRYSGAVDVAGDYGLSMNINSDSRSIDLSIDWNKFGPLSTASAWAPVTEHFQITGFNKDIKEAFVGGLGQSSVGMTLFFLMSDGTVEYMPMFNCKFDSSNTSYYEMNYTYEYSQDGRITGEHFETQGSLTGVSKVVKFYTVSVSIERGGGYGTTIGALADGSFYDFGNIINSN